MLPVGDSLVVYDAKIARALKSIPQAIILQRIVWSINQHLSSKEKYEERFYKNERWWMYDSVDAFCEYSGMSRDQVKLALKHLQEKEFISIEKLEKTNRNHTNFYSINIAKYSSITDWGQNPPSIGGKPTNPSVDNPPFDRRETHQSIGAKPTNLPSKSLPEIQTENPTERGETRVRAHKEDPPTFLGSFEPSLGSNQDHRKDDGSQKASEAPPERLKELYILWERRARNLGRMTPWNALKEISALETMADFYLVSELNEILTHLEKSNSKISMEFIRPSDCRRNFCGTPMIDAAYAEMKAVNKPRQLKRGDPKKMSLEEFKRRFRGG